MTTRRSNGEGTRPKKRADGRWFARIRTVDQTTGQHRRVDVYGRTSTEVSDKIRAIRNEVADRGGYRPPPRTSVEAFLRQWLDDVVKPTVRPGTFRSYRGIVNNHLIPSLGHVQLTRLTPPMIARVLAGDDEDPDAATPRTRELAYIVLNAALDVAVKWELVRANAAAVVDKPRVPKVEIAFLVPAEVDELLAQARHDRHYALYLLAIFSGLRPGEIFALQWPQVDLEAGTVTVTHTLDPETLERGEVKTRRGRRTVDVSPTIMAELRAHRARMLGEGNPHGWVFPAREGGPIRLSNLTRRSWKPLLIATWGGVEVKAPTEDDPDRVLTVPKHDHRLYDLRHTAATLMIAAGVHVKVISERMGHASVAFTMDTYGHVLPTLGKDAALALDRFLAVS